MGIGHQNSRAAMSSSAERIRRKTYRVAHLLLFSFDDHALVEAIRRERDAVAAGDFVRAAHWREIAVAISVLERIDERAA